MHTFKDRNGLEWVIDVNVDALRRIKTALQIDLMELVSDEKFIDRLTGDPILLVDLLFVICQAQAAERNISDQQFGRAMGGDSIEQATQALLEDFVDFFPSRKRMILRAALAKLKGVESRILDIAEAAIADPKLDAMIASAIEKLGATFTDAVQTADASAA